MAKNTLVEKNGIQIKLGDYSVANATSLSDPSILPKTQDYRRQTHGRLFPLDRSDIDRRIPSADFHVSRKIDGEFTVLYFDSENLFTINPGGTIRMGLPWQVEAEAMLKKAGLKQAMIAGELHIIVPDRRCRVHDVSQVARQPENGDDLDRIHFAVFDIIEEDEEPYEKQFLETWERVEEIFQGGTRIAPVEFKTADSSDDIEKIFEEWVEGEGAEGIVARSDSAGGFKIKPRHTIDAAVIGFSEASDDRTGMVHDLLLGLVRDDGAIHVMGRVGGGFSEDERRAMLSDLKDMVVTSEYAEINSDHVAYQMVQPKWVAEISCLDMIAASTRGAPVNRMALHWDSGESRYEVIRRLPLVSVISPQFVRLREDKSVNPQDVGIDQVSKIVEVPMADRDAKELSLPKSEVLRREVYTKQLKGETMVRKFLMWKTNKETESDEFPAYVLHYTDFSPNRKVPLARDVRVSSSLEQIEEMWDEFKKEYCKKGWAAFEGDEDTTKADKPKEPVKKKATKKKATKKKAAKKKVAKKATTKKRNTKKK